MERTGPIFDARNQAMLDGIEPAIVDMVPGVPLIADQVFPIAPLPRGIHCIDCGVVGRRGGLSRNRSNDLSPLENEHRAPLVRDGLRRRFAVFDCGR